MDPPYSFMDRLRMSNIKRGASANYQTLSNKDLLSLPIKDVVDPNGSILSLWVPSSLLPLGLDLMKAYGFEFKQTYIWVKTKKEIFSKSLKPIYKHFEKLGNWNWSINGSLIKECLDKLSPSNMLSFNMGRIFRQTHEICLIGTNNNNIYKLLENKSQRSVSFAENLKHSTKPECLQDSLDIMFPVNVNRLEVFARRQRSNWFCLGNEAPMTYGEDIRTSLGKLASISDNNYDTVNDLIFSKEIKDKELLEFWSAMKG